MKILYFVDSPWPTPEDYEKAKKIGAAIRNSKHVDPNHLEKCTAVAGNIPEAYKGYPTVGGSEFPKAKKPTRAKRSPRAKVKIDGSDS